MKYVVNWIPLRIRVRSRNTQLHLNLTAASKRVSRFCMKNFLFEKSGIFQVLILRQLKSKIGGSQKGTEG